MKKFNYVERLVIVFDENGVVTGSSQAVNECVKSDTGEITSIRSVGLYALNIRGIDNVIPEKVELLNQISILIKERDVARQNFVQVEVGTIAKLTLIDRLVEAGKFSDALAALKLNEFQYERWQALDRIHVDNLEIQGLLKSIGGDLKVLLALES